MRLRPAAWFVTLLCAGLLGIDLIGRCYSGWPTLGKQDWKFLTFSGWAFARGDGSWESNELKDSVPELTFRLQAERLLVGSTRQTNDSKYDSLNWFSVDRQRGHVSSAQRSDWDSALIVATHKDSPFHEAPHIENGSVLYAHRRFTGEGESFGGFALSPDGNWMAVWSWNGENPQPKQIFDLTIARGRLFIDVYRVSTGEKVTELSRYFFPTFPDNEVSATTWIADRYLVVPLSDRSGMWVCDLLPKEPLSSTAWDLVPPGAEILGFGDAPESSEAGVYRSGRFVAVSVDREQAYYVTRTLSKNDIAGDHLVPGIRRIQIGQWNEHRIQGVKLMSSEPLALASADDLGSDEDHPPVWRPGANSTAIAVTPYLGSGSKRMFEFVLSDLLASADVVGSEFLIQTNRALEVGCQFTLDRASGVLTLLDDEGLLPMGALSTNTSGRLQNKQCAVSNPVVLMESPESLIVQVNVEFSSRFSGRKNIYARVREKERASSRWQWLGSWTVRPD